SYFSSSAHAAHQHLRSFPTRRSSDLASRRRRSRRRRSSRVARLTAAHERVDRLVERRRHVVPPRLADERTVDEFNLRRPPGLHRSEEHTSELQSQSNLVCRLLLGKKN